MEIPYFYNHLVNEQLNTDKALFLKIATGDETAFEELFLRYVPRVEPVIINITGSDIILKDIVQEVFLHLWLNRHRLPEVEEPDNWIFKMVYNRSYSWVRKQLVRERYQQESISGQSSQPNIQDPDQWYSFEETARLLQQAIHSLPPQAQKIFELRESGWKAREIAAELGITVDGVKKSIYRSAQNIRSFMISQGIQIPLVLLVWWLKK